jgi:hypothetical protein
VLRHQKSTEDGAPVGYLYREEPDNADDSGWRFTANDESDDYINDSANVALVSLGAVLSVDDRFIALLDEPPARPMPSTITPNNSWRLTNDK